MGQYKLWFSFNLGLGLFISIHGDEIQILIPFIQILIGLHKEANGIYLFGKTI